MTVESAWQGLEDKNAFGTFQLIDELHPGDFYASLNRDGRRGLVLISDNELRNFPHLENLDIRCELQGDGRWRTCIWVQKRELWALFTALADDIVSSSRRLPSGEIGNFTIGRIARWRRLLESGNLNTLPLSEVRGLIGELAVLRELFKLHDPVDAIEAWQGPLDAPQDFVFPGNRIEAKAIRPTALRVQISSVDQLDAPDGQDLWLALVTLASASVELPSAFAASAYVEEIRSLLLDYPRASDEFNSRLLAAGYIDHPDYADLWFRIDGIQYFAVTDSFPRLTRADLADGIADATYDLTISAILQYERTPWR